MKVKNAFGNKYVGTLDDSLTATNWKGRNVLKRKSEPSNPNTSAQQTQRSLFSAAVALWKTFDSYLKGAYGLKTTYEKKQISAFNTMVGSYCDLGGVGGSYVAPPAYAFKVLNDDPLPVEGALVIIKKAGQTTEYARAYSDAAGIVPWTLVTEDQNYDVFITHVDYQNYESLDLTAALTQVDHDLVDA